MKGKKAKFTELRARLHVAQRPVSKRGKQKKRSKFIQRPALLGRWKDPFFFLQSNTSKGSAAQQGVSQEGITM